jgi:trimethylamine:corrinoid methyltransferase-like protein
LDRENYDNWVKAGATDMEERCRKLKVELLTKHKPTPLDNDVKNDLEKILEDAKKNLSE